VSGTQVAQGTLWDEASIEVALAAYDVNLASTSGGKDSSAMLAYLVACARAEGGAGPHGRGPCRPWRG